MEKRENKKDIAISLNESIAISLNESIAISLNESEVFNIDNLIDVIMSSLEKEDGFIDKYKLREFIRETVKLRKSSSEVYEKITKGLLSDWHYPSDTVLSIVDNLQKNMVDKSKVCEDMLCLVQDEGTKQLVLEYFGKIY